MDNLRLIRNFLSAGRTRRDGYVNHVVSQVVLRALIELGKSDPAKLIQYLEAELCVRTSK